MPVKKTSLETNYAPANYTVRFWPVVISGAPAQNLYYCMPVIEAADGAETLTGDVLLIARSRERVLDQALMTSNLSIMLSHVKRFLGKYSVLESPLR